jgi:hypothetical protein
MSFEQPAFNQIEEQAAPATVLIPRSNGEITTGHILQQDPTTGDAVIGVMLEDGAKGAKPAKNELLSDEVQERFAVMLGGQALRTEAEYVAEVLLLGTDEQVKAMQATRQERTDRLNAEAAEENSLAQQRKAADNRYNLARQAGATHDEASKSAGRAYPQPR